MHPTRDRLIEVTVELLDTTAPEDMQVELVLTSSGISRGSLYHHFEDFNHVIEAALVRRFSRRADEDIVFITRAVAESQSSEEFRAAMGQLTRASQADERRGSRFERVRDLGMAGTNERFRTALGAEQARLTAALADLARETQAKGWVRLDVDPTAVAVFLQAYTLGRVTDDVSPEPMDTAAWLELIDIVLQSLLVQPTHLSM
jgi:AcrR family transcriptional regulator